MNYRRGLALVLVSIVLALYPFVYADSPDQLWLGGFFDGGDEDDVLVTIELNLNAIEVPATDISPAGWIAQVPPEPAKPIGLFRPVASGQIRAPPPRKPRSRRFTADLRSKPLLR